MPTLGSIPAGHGEVEPIDRRNLALFLVGGLVVALGLAFFVSPYASGSPDGLERVAIDHGFAEKAKDHTLADGPLADHQVRGLDHPRLSTGCRAWWPATTMTIPALEVRDPWFAYPDGGLALSGVDLTIMPGERVAVLGPNGAGKTSSADGA